MMSTTADLARITRALERYARDERYARRRPMAGQSRLDFEDRPLGVTPPPAKEPAADPQGTLGDFARRRRSFDAPRGKPVQGSLFVEENPSLRAPKAREPKPDQMAFLEGQEGAELKMRAAQAPPARPRPRPEPGMGPRQASLPDETGATPGMGPHRAAGRGTEERLDRAAAIRVERAFGRTPGADRRNMAMLADLRRHLPGDRAAQDATLRRARLGDAFTAESYEGRHGPMTREQVDAAIRDASGLLPLLSRRTEGPGPEFVAARDRARGRVAARRESGATPGMGPHRVAPTALDPPPAAPSDDEGPGLGPDPAPTDEPFDPRKPVAIRFNRPRTPAPPAAGAARAVAGKLRAMPPDRRRAAMGHIRGRDPGMAAAIAGLGLSSGEPAATPGMGPHRVAPEPAPAELPLDEFARKVVDTARGMDTGRFGDDKVFISHLYRRMQSDPALAGMDLDTFKRKLAEANNKRHLDVSRADLVQAMDPDDVRESESEFPRGFPDLPAHTFHFVRAPRRQGDPGPGRTPSRPRPPATPGAQSAPGLGPRPTPTSTSTSTTSGSRPYSPITDAGQLGKFSHWADVATVLLDRKTGGSLGFRRNKEAMREADAMTDHYGSVQAAYEAADRLAAGRKADEDARNARASRDAHRHVRDALAAGQSPQNLGAMANWIARRLASDRAFGAAGPDEAMDAAEEMIANAIASGDIDLDRNASSRRPDRYARRPVGPSGLKPTMGQGGFAFEESPAPPAGPPSGPKAPVIELPPPRRGAAATQGSMFEAGGFAEPRGEPRRTVVIDPEEQARPRMPKGRAQRMRPMAEQAPIPAVARPEQAPAPGLPAAELARAVAEPGRHLLVSGAKVDDPRWASGVDPHLEHVHTFDHPELGPVGVYRGADDEAAIRAGQFLAGQHSLHGGFEPMGGEGPLSAYVMGLARAGQPSGDDDPAGGLGPAPRREFRMRPERPASEQIRRPPPLPPAGRPQATPEPTAVAPEVESALAKEHDLLRRMRARTPDQSARLLMHEWRAGRVGADAEGNPLDHGRAERFANLLRTAIRSGNAERAEQLAGALGTRNPALALRAADDYRRLHHLGEIRPAIPVRPGNDIAGFGAGLRSADPESDRAARFSNLSPATRAALARQRTMFADEGKDAAIAGKTARDASSPRPRDDIEVSLDPGSPAAKVIRGMGFGGEAGYRRFLASRGLYRSSNSRVRYAGQLGFDFGGEAVPGFPRPKEAAPAPALRSRVRKEPATPAGRPKAESGASFADVDIRQGSAGPSEAESAAADLRGSRPRADRVAARLKAAVGPEESDPSDAAHREAARTGRIRRVDELEFVRPEAGMFSGPDADEPAEGVRGVTPDEGAYRAARAGKAGRSKLDTTDSLGALLAVAKGLATPDRATDVLKTKSERLLGTRRRPSRAKAGDTPEARAASRRKRLRAAVERELGEVEEASVAHPGLGPMRLARPERAAIRSNRAALRRGVSNLHGNS